MPALDALSSTLEPKIRLISAIRLSIMWNICLDPAGEDRSTFEDRSIHSF
ncbi:Uncharacterised protein [Mycobacteroides abscessus subsp. abscessus]|nr:Uncharacterised protein [Mycobacteroides abscessus subsp. abscessus]